MTRDQTSSFILLERNHRPAADTQVLVLRQELFALVKCRCTPVQSSNTVLPILKSGGDVRGNVSSVRGNLSCMAQILPGKKPGSDGHVEECGSSSMPAGQTKPPLSLTKSTEREYPLQLHLCSLFCHRAIGTLALKPPQVIFWKALGPCWMYAICVLSLWAADS